MRKKKKALVKFKAVGWFFLIIVLVACGGRFTTYNGSWVAEDHRISLQDGGPHEGNWQTRDVAIEFAYHQKPQYLQNYGYRRDLDFIGGMTFDHQLALPPDTAAIAFGYRGRVSEGGGRVRDNGGGDRIDWEFWKIPGRKPSE